MAKEYFTVQFHQGDWVIAEGGAKRAGLHHGRRDDSHERKSESDRWQPEPATAQGRVLPGLKLSGWLTLFLTLQVLVEELDGLLKSLVEFLSEPAVSFAFHGYQLGVSFDFVQG
jgi:hypothetical protein